MKQKVQMVYITTVMGVFFLTISLMCIFHKQQKISMSERRYLKTFPNVTTEGLRSGKNIEEFESYTLDQFPLRDSFRTIKALTQFNVFRQKDNNNIYVKDGYVYKIFYPLSESSIVTAGNKFNDLYEKYFKGTDVSLYYSIIPDKSYFTSKENGYPAIDDTRLVELMNETVEHYQYIDIYDCLSLEDYYLTDTHWKQTKLSQVVDKISQTMGFDTYLSKEYQVKSFAPFYGVYYGQSALPIKPDTLEYMTNQTMEEAITYNYETNQSEGVYNLKKLNGMDAYDVFLSGATPLITIENPNAKREKELVIFRDSFGSSIAPLFLEGYSKITLIDIRYMSSSVISEYISFQTQDVLFLYSTLVLNNSTMLK